MSVATTFESPHGYHRGKSYGSTSFFLNDSITPSLSKQWKRERGSKKKTYNSRYSLVVTDPTTNQPLSGLTMGERTGSRIFHWVWSYVLETCAFPYHIFARTSEVERVVTSPGIFATELERTHHLLLWSYRIITFPLQDQVRFIRTSAQVGIVQSPGYAASCCSNKGAVQTLTDDLAGPEHNMIFKAVVMRRNEA